MEIKRAIKYERELDKTFSEAVAELSGCEKIFECIQCGTCSSTCPVSLYMDYTPRKLMAMIKAGFKEDALRSVTIWICSSCYSCTVMCPAEIKITDVMYALKRMAIQGKIFPRRFPTPILAKEMTNIITSEGRNSELWVVLKMLLKTNPLKLLTMASIGIPLFLKGRMDLKKESIKKKDELRSLYKAMKEAS
ncbi:MAG: 4Fe-4S dicluster domain-containing protein [Candidatus Aminicenantia bacterium]